MIYECARCHRNFTAVEEPETCLCPGCIISEGAVERSAQRDVPCPNCDGPCHCGMKENPHGVGPDNFLFEAPLQIFEGRCHGCRDSPVPIRHVSEYRVLCQACFETPPPILCSDCGEELKQLDGYYRCPPCDREVRP